MSRFVWVDSAPVRAHLRSLLDAGLTVGVIASRAGLHIMNVRHLTAGVRGHDTAVTRRDIALALLAVDADAIGPERHRWVDATGTVRRLRDLTAAGWPILQLARMTDTCKDTLRASLYGRHELIRTTTRDKIAALHPRLLATAPPAGCGPARARTIAARHGWTVIPQWSGSGIDDAHAHPIADRPGTVEAIEDLLGIEPDLTAGQVAARLDRRPDTIGDALRRSGRRDLLDQLAANKTRRHYRETT